MRMADEGDAAQEVALCSWLWPRGPGLHAIGDLQVPGKDVMLQFGNCAVGSKPTGQVAHSLIHVQGETQPESAAAPVA